MGRKKRFFLRFFLVFFAVFGHLRAKLQKRSFAQRWPLYNSQSLLFWKSFSTDRTRCEPWTQSLQLESIFFCRSQLQAKLPKQLFHHGGPCGTAKAYCFEKLFLPIAPVAIPQRNPYKSNLCFFAASYKQNSRKEFFTTVAAVEQRKPTVLKSCFSRSHPIAYCFEKSHPSWRWCLKP